ncbi:monofunctional biosynthetic peptidoglycan transglycosylase [Thalassococcus sp. S3]|uniref:monofunctional biosynthetic peptidoglycan transglycosylase n=1 Tax=Thalassococcus sp. S3 TaxID=2017482 RepID=UPI0010246FCB|nr:monofunctional biosynthetic peptidoglycan transglycosylase [Thalassococcus sp. S3]QBF34057.1 monofunctional biosynthetic peptidoglycan transglycosylase [Thalassococcus sp. S3]
MAKAKTSRKAKPLKTVFRPGPLTRLGLWLRRWMWRMVALVVAVPVLVVLLFKVVNPPMGIYMRAEAARLGVVDREWVPLEAVAPVMARSVVAAEDANFCRHWGFDVEAIRAALAEGSRRGGSTISQQVVKNVFLWHGRSWTRKALEAGITPMMEILWSKRRIVEVYLNVAEFDEGVFGVEAAARHYFGVGPEALSAVQAARLAAVLPNPKARSASRPSDVVRRRAAGIRDGAATIRADGRAACFESPE